MSKESLIEYRDHLVDQAEQIQLRHQITALEAALGGAQHAQNLQESGRYLTPEMYHREVGFGDSIRDIIRSEAADRQHGRYWPYIKDEQDLQFIRGVGRGLTTMDAAGVGI